MYSPEFKRLPKDVGAKIIEPPVSSKK